MIDLNYILLEISETPVVGWLINNWFWVWLSLKVLGFIAEQTKNIEWDNNLVDFLEKLARYLLPGKAPFFKDLDEDKEKESKSKKIEKKVRDQIRKL